MKKVLHLFNSGQGLFLCILIIGAALRFFNPLEIPFTHDELSALNRLKFDTFSQLIEGGVKVDGHPALIQVFLYYYTSIVGYSEFMVKFPFLLLGLGSIYLIYLISKSWFTPTSALVSASFMASLQFPIMFSQIARPYISGLFFCLLLVYYWDKYLFRNGKSKRTLAGLILAAALCSYNHYFSLMFAGFVGITGLLYLNKENFKSYLIGMVIILVLFIPHFSIFLIQFSGKGLDWLGAPSPFYILEHVQYVFHFSPWVYATVVLIIGFGIFKSQKIKHNRFQLISLIWFLIPITIGVAYSILVKPVVQHSMLLFSFPFLILFISSFVGEWNLKLKQLSIGLILITNISTLVFSREHYTVFYHQPFEQTFHFCKDAKENYTAEIILNDNPSYLNFYFDTSEIQYQSTFNVNEKPFEFRNRIQKIKTNYLIVGNLPRNLVDIAKEYFSIPIKKEEGLNYSIVLLGKQDHEESALHHYLFSSTFFTENISNNWQPFSSSPLTVEMADFALNKEMEFGPILETRLNGILNNRYGVVKISLDYFSNHNNNGLITLTVFHKDKQVLWQGISLDEYKSPKVLNHWNTAYLNVSLTNIIKPNNSLSDYKIKVLYWNKDHQPIQIRNFKVSIATGNKYEFATIEPI